jgi:hypothetical protein
MNKLKIILFALACFTFATCKKINYKATSVKGVFWDYCGERPMPGLKVALLEGTYKGSGYSIRTIKELTTNTDGTFDFGEFDADKREHKHFYKVVYLAGDSDHTSRGLGGAKGVKNISEWKIIPHSINKDTLRICGRFLFMSRINPPPPYDLNDSLTIKYTSNYGNNFGGNILLEFVKTNGNIGNEPNSVFAGNYDIVITKIKNNVKTTTKSKVYFGWKQHQTYIIDFN